MPFDTTLEFGTTAQKEAFTNEFGSRVRGIVSDATGEDAELAERSVTVTVTSPSAAKEVCSLVLAFLAHQSNSQVNLTWQGANGQPQHGEIATGGQKDAEVIAMRLSGAAKGKIDAEKKG